MTTNLTQALRHGAEHALESMAEGWRELRSRAGVIEEDDKVVVRLEAPGMRRDDFTVELQDAMPSVRGEKRVDRESKSAGYRVVECAYGAFRRDVPLPVAVLADTVTASYRDGVLRVTLPKAEGARARRWAVEVK